MYRWRAMLAFPALLAACGEADAPRTAVGMGPVEDATDRVGTDPVQLAAAGAGSGRNSVDVAAPSSGIPAGSNEAARVEVIETKWISTQALADTLTDLTDASRRAARVRAVDCALSKPGNRVEATTVLPMFFVFDERHLGIRLPPATAEELPRIRQLVERLDVPLVDPVLPPKPRAGQPR
jgi:hypothetical protein